MTARARLILGSCLLAGPAMVASACAGPSTAGVATGAAQAEGDAAVDDVVFDFSDATASATWQVVNDVVMGGRSRSRFEADGEHAAFSGVVSAENNGGFASARASLGAARLPAAPGVRLRVRGDGKTYRFRARTDAGFDTGVAYQASFATVAGAWVDVELAFADFELSVRGRPIRGAPLLAPGEIRQVGFLIGDGQLGAFRLEIAWIRVAPAAAAR